MSLTDYAWAAGFLEGEGCFRKNGGSQCVVVPQVNMEPLVRLQAWFGGRIGRTHTREFPINTWTVTGSRARGVMMTLYSFMSSRRKEQIRRALGIE